MCFRLRLKFADCIFICMLLGLLCFNSMQHGFFVIIPSVFENGSPFWILKIFDTPRGVSLVHMSISTYVDILGLLNSSNTVNVIEYPLSFIHYQLYSQYVVSIYRQMSMYMFVHMNIYSFVNRRTPMG